MYNNLREKQPCISNFYFKIDVFRASLKYRLIQTALNTHRPDWQVQNSKEYTHSVNIVYTLTDYDPKHCQLVPDKCTINVLLKGI